MTSAERQAMFRLADRLLEYCMPHEHIKVKREVADELRRLAFQEIPNDGYRYLSDVSGSTVRPA